MAEEEVQEVPIPHAEGTTVVEAGLLVVDLEALARHVDTRLGPNPDPEDCQHTFYALANV
jgi:hypothetical protein